MTPKPKRRHPTAPAPIPSSVAADDVSRRDLLTGAATVLGGVLVGGLASPPAAQSQKADPAVPGPRTPTPTSAVGARSRFVEAPARAPIGELTGHSSTPLEDLTGTITPSDLHFERHHAGVPAIDPARHRLVVHGLVERPLEFSLDDLRRFPQTTRIHFIECSGNGRAAFRDPRPDMTPQKVDGQTSNSEWTGVALSTVFRETGAKAEAKWFLAEGADDCRMTRSIPIEKAWDDALIVWAQNGEPLRPEQGFPLRLLLPGWEGNVNVKWLRRLELGREPWMTRWETSKYTDPLINGTARQFSFDMDAKSIITAPAYPSTLAARGWHAVSGIAWSGRGRIARVEVSSDSGRTWSDATLQAPVLPRAHTRFVHMWEWHGEETILLSRATDETGYVQPTRQQLVDTRGAGTDFHFNSIRGWRVQRDGAVFFHGLT